MQELEEQDTCRICSAPAEPDQPLFHPCKCSGTIRYIHQDCLTTWLAHSKKKTCDVCKHSYSFTKVYAPDMPSRIPPFLLIRRLIQQLFFGIFFVLRAIIVAIIWLAVLPWVTIWTWRMYFAMGESTAWWISDRPRPVSNDTYGVFARVKYDPIPMKTDTLFDRVTTHPLWVMVSADIFTGQIIAALIVLTFVAIFLLREWISQNARPGLFEEDEIPVDEAVNAPPPMPDPLPPRIPHQEIEGFPEADLAERQQHAIRVMDEFRLQDAPSSQATTPVSVTNSSHSGNDRDEGRNVRRRSGLFPSVEENQFAERMFRPEQKRRLKIARHLAAKRRIAANKQEATRRDTSTRQDTLAIPQEPNFAFTFKLDSPSAGSSFGGPSTNWPTEASPSEFSTPSSGFFPQVSLERPKEDIPFSLRGWKSTIEAPNDEESLPPASPQRPPLPSSVSPMPIPPNFLSQTEHTPSMPSPSLATYRAPEEFVPEAGPSYPSEDYFERVPSDTESSEGLEYLPRPPHTPAEFPPSMGFAPLPQTDSYGQNLVLLTDSEDSETEDEDDLEPFEGPQYEQRRGPLFYRHEDEEDHEDEDEDDEDEDEDEDDEDERDLFFREPEEILPQPPVVPPIDGAVPAPAPGADGEGAAIANPPEGPMGFENPEEIEGNMEDDMDGAMEAIGMRGPLFGVLQNAALMVFVLDTAIGLCIWIPFTVGKTVALLSLDYQRTLHILHLPIKAIRLVTDPIVDSVVYFITRFMLPPCLNLLRGISHVTSVVVTLVVSKLLSKQAAQNVSEISTNWYDHSVEFLDSGLAKFHMLSLPSQMSSNVTVPPPEHLFPPFAQPIEPYFELLGRSVRISATQFQDTWVRLALGSGPSERVFAILIGYIVFGFILALYMNVFTVGNARTAGRAIRSAVKQQLIVMKVAGFIFIELILFPFACGVVLDASTVWLFPEASLQSRAAFFGQAPLTAMFYHWIAGTVFMYSFAVLLSGCRSVMRPGAMWFIKDPQDHNSHPIRDIMERPTLVQLRKITVSAFMYALVVVCVVGSVAGLLLLGNKSIMPFRWKNREPLSNVPIDLLFLHLLLPHTMQYFRPRRGLKALATKLWRVLAENLRLTSYFFGGRYPAEEFRTDKWFHWPWSDPDTEEQWHLDGTLRRVPATDNIALPRTVRATAQVNADGTPFDDEAAQLMALQNSEAEKARHDVDKDYVVVFIPPMFRYRVFTFIFLLWIAGALFLGVSVALPVQLGRSFFSLFTTREVHDGYSFIVGFYSLWTCYLCGRAIDRLDKQHRRRVQNAASESDRPRDVRILAIKRTLFWMCKVAYMGFFLGVVIPILVAFVIDLYVVLPIRSTLNPSVTPRVRVVDSWAIGLLYAKIAMHLVQIQPTNQVAQGIKRVVDNGWIALDAVAATKEVIAPLVGGLLGMILLPATLLHIARIFLPTMVGDSNSIFMHTYPAIFLFVGLIRSTVVLYDVLSTWSQTIRDKEFLVELRLKNHDPKVEGENRTQVVEGEIQFNGL
ncbi:hypothetical protein FA15DRAFT_675738 [Coprinopsis marcescibilis]|uniref:RING-type E3 ubiquitin transferase n=1 Tax=Coprinopsis marcescibilis TaxID=230819 RepID=A0A5C3KD60_COPMA|nr:hypothetical protein FA15DRAFT_675738 [Coprinopsis marcescibilis]